MKYLFIILMFVATKIVYAQEGVDMNSMNADITKVTHTVHVEAKFTFGLLTETMLKWQMDYYNLAYKEFFFEILSKDVSAEKHVYLVRDISKNNEKQITFFFSEHKMVLIQEEGVAPLVMIGDVEF